MQTQRGLPAGLALIALSGLAFASWTTMRPAVAQEDPGFPGGQPPPGRRMMFGGPGSVAASGNVVYVLRGNTLYQIRANDLSLIRQMELPEPGLGRERGENADPNPDPNPPNPE